MMFGILFGIASTRGNAIDHLECESKLDVVGHKVDDEPIGYKESLSECIEGHQEQNHEQLRNIKKSVKNHGLDQLEHNEQEVENLIHALEVVATEVVEPCFLNQGLHEVLVCPPLIFLNLLLSLMDLSLGSDTYLLRSFIVIRVWVSQNLFLGLIVLDHDDRHIFLPKECNPSLG